MADDVKTGIRVVVEGTDDFATDLNSVASALDNAKSSAEGAEGAINSADSATGELAQNAPAHTAAFAGDMETKMLQVAAVIGTVISVILEVQGAIIDLANATAAQGDAVAKGAQKLGFSTDAYQEWDYVLKKNGSSMDKASGAISKLTQNISAGGKKPTEALETLGLSLEELQGMNPEQQFATIVGALQQVEDLGTKTDLATALFGAGGAKNLGTLLTSTGEDVTALTQQAHDLNLVMSEESIQASADYQNSIEDFQNTIQGIKNTIGEEFMPVVQNFRSGIQELITGIDWTAFAEALGSAIGPAVEFLNTFILPLAQVSLTGVVATLQLLLEILGGLGSFAMGPVEYIKELLNPGGELGDGHTLAEYAANVEEATAAYAQAQENFDALSEAGADTTAAAIELNQKTTALRAATAEYERAKKALEGGGETGGKTPTETGGGTAPEQTNQQIQGAATEAETAALQMMQTYDEAAGTITSNFIQGTDEASQAAVESIENLNDTMALNMAELNNNAYIWGMDMMRLLANGIADGSNTYILPAIDQLTELIKSRLGYSEPSVGPLARTHTWMPDMMALLARGIRDSSWMVARALGEAFDLAPVLSARGGSSFNYGGVSVQIYAAPGQSVDELYNVFSYRLARDVADREAVFST